jgi:hypothetical protein
MPGVYGRLKDEKYALHRKTSLWKSGTATALIPVKYHILVFSITGRSGMIVIPFSCKSGRKYVPADWCPGQLLTFQPPWLRGVASSSCMTAFFQNLLCVLIIFFKCSKFECNCKKKGVEL